MNRCVSQWLFAGTIFASAFSLFLVQPLIAKQILPWFGGSAAVWAICMVFFQLTLLAGYAYSDVLATHLKPRMQLTVHGVLLLASLLFLPILASEAWKPTGAEDPSWLIIGLLAATIGLPYFLLSTTGPLLQSWLAQVNLGSQVYRLFSLSNLASLLALLSYPFLIETQATLRAQAVGWSTLFAAFAVLCSAAGMYFVRHAQPVNLPVTVITPILQNDAVPGWRDYVLWLAPAALASWLLVAITNHMTQNVASIPFLWIVPLTLYLLTFVLCFESNRWYQRKVFMPAAAVLLVVCAYGLQDGDIGVQVKVAIPLYSLCLFVLCMFFHGELARLRPHTRYLTRFYLMLSVGGALGGTAVGLVAPKVLPAFYELGLGFTLTGLLAVVMFRHSRVLMAGAVLLVLWCAFFLYRQVADDVSAVRQMERNFYGSLSTVDVPVEELRDTTRRLFHGATRHGEQFLSEARRREPTAYYGRTAGVGLAIEATRREGQQVGMIGLGAGTLAVYGRTGDRYRIYEIDPAVIQFAQTEFTFMADSLAKVETVLGDARLSMERESPQAFDVLAVDAFSGGSVPIHLLTVEAMGIYLRHMRPDGIVAFHVTNRFLNIPPVVDTIARSMGLHVAHIRDDNDNPLLRNTDWVLVARNPAVLQQPIIAQRAKPIPHMAGLKPWTDDFNNLFAILK